LTVRPCSGVRGALALRRVASPREFNGDEMAVIATSHSRAGKLNNSRVQVDAAISVTRISVINLTLLLIIRAKYLFFFTITPFMRRISGTLP
jgi:hypothetical protein